MLSTSYPQIVDNLADGGQLRFYVVDDFGRAISCSKNEILITRCCISENNDFFPENSAFFFFGKMRDFA